MTESALILGYVPRITIAVARSLQRQGAQVDVATFQAGEKFISSRAIRHFYRVPSPDSFPDGFESDVLNIINCGKHAVLIPVNDHALTAVMEHYHGLSQAVHIGCPPPDILQLILDKSATLTVAQAAGLRIPKTCFVSSAGEIVSAA